MILALLLLAVAAFVPAHSADPDRAPREAQVEAILRISEAAVANPRFLDSVEWHDFVEYIRDPQTQALGDAEFRTAFNQAAQALPFSHYRLLWRTPQTTRVSSDASGVRVETAAPAVALLRVEHFEMPVARMVEALARVAAGAYSGLVIDVRGNEGGSFPSVATLARFLDNRETDTGVFLTRLWFERHGEYPDSVQRASIPALAELNLDAFAKQLAQTGAARLVLPAHDDPVFAGRVVVLTDRETASASEPFVDLVQQAGAVVVGERTAGAMLSAERLAVDETFRLFVPVADYMTADGRRLDKVGVIPDLEVPATEALERALELLEQQDRADP